MDKGVNMGVNETMKLDEQELKNIFDNDLKNWLSFKNDNEKTALIKSLSNLEFTSPKREDVFNAFKIGKNNSIIDPKNVRVLILGQDPYPEVERAHGLAFSFKGNQEPNDSLLNILKAIATYRKQNDNIYTWNTWNTNLETWAKKQKILLLNTSLTFKSKKNPHFEFWNDFIKNIMKILVQTKLDNKCNNNLAIFLWGKEAQNIFSQSLNKLKAEEKERFCKIESLRDKRTKKSLKFKNIKRLIRNEQGIQEKCNICIYMTSHPSNNYQSVKKGFSEDAPNHFESCDEFLFGTDEEKYIFKNFPENNQK